MLRTILRKQACLRLISLGINRMCQTEQQTMVSKVVSDSITPKVIEEVAPSVQHRPFEELHIKDEESKDQHSDIGEYVDSLTRPLAISFNLAAYVNQSESLQNLIRLGVDLSEMEKKPETAKFILLLDFEKDMKRHIQFLHDHGMKAEDLGKFITKNPFIFKETLEDLEVRINYLKSKRFDDAAISWILTSNPFFLSLETLKVDSRLGFFQKQFSLSGNEVRFLITKYPKFITFNFNLIRVNLFVIKEELGYDSYEMKKLLLMKPKIYTLGRRCLTERFHILHNLMKLSHEDILKCPSALLRRGFILKERHLYLEHLGRAQYDPTQPLYVSLSDFATLSDSAFCETCARTSVDQYNAFLRTI